MLTDTLETTKMLELIKKKIKSERERKNIGNRDRGAMAWRRKLLKKNVDGKQY